MTVFFLPRMLFAVGVGAVLADPPPSLRVLRVMPDGDASPTTTISVTFDRPVAGSLDRSVDPAAILTLRPATPGTVEWRDPVTLRFRPRAPLAANHTYSVTVANTFLAMDGSRLAEPYRFAFRVRGPRVLDGWPARAGVKPSFLAADATFEIALDAAADPALLRRLAFVELGKACHPSGVVRLRVVSQRVISESDRWELREAGGWERDRAADPMRRVVRLAPIQPLPPGCDGVLVLPQTLDDRGATTLLRWEFATHGNFRILGAGCGWQEKDCPTGPVRVEFSTPVAGAEVLRHIRLVPSVPFSLGDTTEERAVWSLEAPLRPRTGYAVVADAGLQDIFGQRLTGNPVAAMATTGFAPAVGYAHGLTLIERKEFGTLPVTHVNVRSLDVAIAPVPDSLAAEFLGQRWGWQGLWPALSPGVTRRRIVRGDRDRVRLFGVKLPVTAARRGRAAQLLAVRISSPELSKDAAEAQPIAVVQVTDLAVHARIGTSEGAVWVTGASDGRPRPGATVVLYDPTGVFAPLLQTRAMSIGIPASRDTSV